VIRRPLSAACPAHSCLYRPHPLLLGLLLAYWLTRCLTESSPSRPPLYTSRAALPAVERVRHATSNIQWSRAYFSGGAGVERLRVDGGHNESNQDLRNEDVPPVRLVIDGLDAWALLPNGLI